MMVMLRCFVFLGALFGLAAGHAGDLSSESSFAETKSVADHYYAAFQGGDLDRVVMADDLKFVSPRFKLDSATAFRGALMGLFARVESLNITSQMYDHDTVLTFYDLDLGTGGPIPMAEKLKVVEGKLEKVDLLFDSARLSPPEL